MKSLFLIFCLFVGLQSHAALNQNDAFTVVVWNIQKGEDDRWTYQLEDMGAQSDLILVQEAKADTGYFDFIARQFYVETSVGFQFMGMSSAVATLSREKAVFSEALRSDSREFYTTTRKAMLVTKYEVAGADDLLVINIHSLNFRLGTSGYLDQLNQLKPYVLNHRGPVIFAGDFNTWNLSPNLQGDRKQLLDRFMHSIGLDEVVFDRQDQSSSFGGEFDHIYIRGLETTTVRHLDSHSDHNAIMGTFEFSR